MKLKYYYDKEYQYILFQISRNMKNKILLFGNSELSSLTGIKRELETLNNIDIYLNFRPGRSFTQSLYQFSVAIQKLPPMDFIFIFGLSCSFWKKCTVTPQHQNLKAITFNDAFDLASIPPIMKKLHKVAIKKSPNVKIFLVLPSIKDIFTFNLHQFAKDNLTRFNSFLYDSPIFNQSYLNTKSRLVYNRSKDLMTSKYWWPGKHTFDIHAAFHLYYSERLPSGTDGPHYLFLHDKTNVLGAWDMLYDGLHYTQQAFRVMFSFWNDSLLKPPRHTPIRAPSLEPIPEEDEGSPNLPVEVDDPQPSTSTTLVPTAHPPCKRPYRRGGSYKSRPSQPTIAPVASPASSLPSAQPIRDVSLPSTSGQIFTPICPPSSSTLYTAHFIGQSASQEPSCGSFGSSQKRTATFPSTQPGKRVCSNSSSTPSSSVTSPIVSVPSDVVASIGSCAVIIQQIMSNHPEITFAAICQMLQNIFNQHPSH